MEIYTELQKGWNIVKSRCFWLMMFPTQLLLFFLTDLDINPVARNVSEVSEGGAKYSSVEVRENKAGVRVISTNVIEMVNVIGKF